MASSSSMEANPPPPPPASNSKADWVEWYRRTFKSELSLLESENVVLDHVLFNTSKASPASSKVAATTSAMNEAEQLRRRLKAVDAIESLTQEVDRVVPIPRRLWEADAPECRACASNLGWTRLRRRHHCRYCGLTFCDDCTTGEIRRCRSCALQKARFEALKSLRSIERDVLADCTKEGVSSVAKAYRKAIQLFADEETNVGSSSNQAPPPVHPLLDEESSKRFLQRARSVLMEGMQTFLDLAETKACFKGSPTSS